MKKITRVITDCCDCLLDYRGGFLKKHPEYRDTFIFPAELNLAFRTSDAIRNLEPCDGAKEFVSKLLGGGLEIDIVSSLGNEPGVRENRLINLDKVFGPKSFGEIHILPYRADKSEALNGLGYDPDATVFIDDALVHLEQSRYLNIWNRSNPGNKDTRPTAEQMKHIWKIAAGMSEAADIILGHNLRAESRDPFFVHKPNTFLL